MVFTESVYNYYMRMFVVKAYADLLRAHFIPAWILIFVAGFLVGVHHYGGFSWILLFQVIGIAVGGFEAGMVLNDFVDRELDTKDTDKSLTGYFRPFKTRPLAHGLIPAAHAARLILLLASAAGLLILLLPSPHRYYVGGIMLYAYLVEYYYQVKKRKQTFPWSQLIGRTDFSLFPIAGYLVVGQPDMNTLLYFLYFYPLALTHLAINDLADIVNDAARQLWTIPRLYGVSGTIYWILGFGIVHLLSATHFVLQVLPQGLPGFLVSYIPLGIALGILGVRQTSQAALRCLPLIHLTMAIQAISLIVAAVW